jgi:uncharacterized protein (DUF697 family)
VSILSRGLGAAMAVRPWVQRFIDIDHESKQTSAIEFFPGEETGTAFLRDLLGGSANIGDSDLVVWAPTGEIAGRSDALVARKHQGTRVRALLVGTPAERRRLERAIGVGRGLEVSDTIQVSSLTGMGARRVGLEIARALEDQALAAGRQRPAFRAAVGEWLIIRASRRAAAVGTVDVAGLALISAIQMRMVASIAAMFGRELGAQSAADAAVILGAGFGLRTVARFGVRGIPMAAPLVRGGVAYASTRALGELAYLRFSGGQPLVAGMPEQAQSAVEKILERFPGADPGQIEGSEG